MQSVCIILTSAKIIATVAAKIYTRPRKMQKDSVCKLFTGDSTQQCV